MITWDWELGRGLCDIPKCQPCLDTSVNYVVEQDTSAPTIVSAEIDTVCGFASCFEFDSRGSCILIEQEI